MAVRLGLDHDAVTGFNKVILTLREVAHLIAMPSDHADFRGALAATKKAEQEFQAARDAFMKFAVRTVGSKLP